MITKKHPNPAFVLPFGNLLGNTFGRDISQLLGHDDPGPSVPRVNIAETPQKFVVSLSVPGFAKEDLKISTEKHLLTVKGEKATITSDENERCLRREFQTNAFSRSFSLPDTVNVDAISAEQVNGVLTVNIPKVEPAKASTREITIA